MPHSQLGIAITMFSVITAWGGLQFQEMYRHWDWRLAQIKA
jgi:hypothetical protein